MAHKVSVVIPCRNEADTIEKCIRSVLGNDFAVLEIIVVDGMSDDGTRQIVEALSLQFKNLRLIDNPEKLTPFALNYGVRNAVGDFIQRVDARQVLCRNYIAQMVAALEAMPEVGCVGGNCQHLSDNRIGQCIAWAMQSKFGVGLGNFRTIDQSRQVDTVMVPMFRRTVFDRVGYFDQRLTRNQDDEFSYRLKLAGYKIYYLAEASSTYVVRDNYKKLFRQMAQYGYFKVLVNRIHRRITTLRQIVPALLLMFLVLGLLICLATPKFVWPYCLVIALYLFLGFYAASRKATNLIDILATHFAMLVMHIGYGYGYWRGIFDFMIRNKQPDPLMERTTT